MSGRLTEGSEFDLFIRSVEVNNRLQLTDLFLDLSLEMQSKPVFTGLSYILDPSDKGQSVNQLVCLFESVKLNNQNWSDQI